MFDALKVVVPAPSCFTTPLPEMVAVIVVASLWLKLITPVPAPKAMLGAVIVPAVSLVPKRPMFSVAEDPFDAAMVRPEPAEALPPLATVRMLLRPALPTKRLRALLQREPAPVTSTLLLSAGTSPPM